MKYDGDVAALYQRYINNGILGGVVMNNGILFAVTEKRTKEEIEKLISCSF